MINVIHVYKSYFPDPPGGLQEAIRQICISTHSFGVQNTVFTLSPYPQPEILEYAETKVIRCRSWGAPASCDMGDIHAIAKLRELANKADIIHYHYPWPFADLMNLFVSSSKTKILTYHSDIVRQYFLQRIYYPLMKRTLHSMDCVVATSPSYTKTSTILSKYVQPNKLKIIPLGIEENSYTASSDLFVLQRWNLDDGEPFILFLGVLRYYKGLHFLLNACAETAGRVVIAGSGPEDVKLRAQAQLLGLNNVIFTGQVSTAEKTALLKACRALVLPSHLRSEAYGMVLVEASMFSKPMISCEIGTGTSFVNKHEETGFVVSPESPSSLAQAMNRLLADSALAYRFGHAARQRYEQLFSGYALGKAYAQLYQEMLEKQ